MYQIQLAIQIRAQESVNRWQATIFSIDHVELLETESLTEATGSADWQITSADQSGKTLVMPLCLYPDECERYYFNLNGRSPRLMLLADLLPLDNTTRDETLQCRSLTLDFDLASAFEEKNGLVLSTALPDFLFPLLMTFLSKHYEVEKRYKRKRSS